MTNLTYFCVYIILFIVFVIHGHPNDGPDGKGKGKGKGGRSREQRYQPPPGYRPIPQTTPEPFLNCALCSWYAGYSTTTTAAPKTDKQCPCIPDASGVCRPYNSKYMADTIDEAILNFPDLTDAMGKDLSETQATAGTTPPFLPSFLRTGPAPAPPVHDSTMRPPQPQPYTNGRECKSDECRVCSRELINRLEANGALSGSNSMTTVRTRLGLNNYTATPLNCSKYSFSRRRFPGLNDIRPPDLPLATVNDITYKIAYGENPPVQFPLPVSADSPKTGNNASIRPMMGFAFPSQNQYPTPSDTVVASQCKNMFNNYPPRGRDSQPPQSRPRRQTSSLDQFVIPPPAVGKRYKIACVKRGEPINASSKWVSLCNLCWVWRELPQNYFPQYLNELTCTLESGAKSCLAGYGQCNAETRSVDVLPDRSNPSRVETIEVSTACSCQVAVGSALHNFARL